MVNNTDIIESWDRKKYPKFTDYLESEDYKKWKEKNGNGRIL